MERNPYLKDFIEENNPTIHQIGNFLRKHCWNCGKEYEGNICLKCGVETKKIFFGVDNLLNYSFLHPLIEKEESFFSSY